jgi:NAD(P)-dependent dehydrogenase (short-subunit alcohol dehydrogenase family)
MTTVAIVTGAGSGIGAASVVRLARTVDVVLAADLDTAGLRATADALAAAGGGARCDAITLDVTDAEAVGSLTAQVDSLGTLRSVVHAAGISPTMGEWRDIVTVDLVGTALLVDALRPLVTNGTAIVCVASMAAHLAAEPNPAADAAVDDPLADDFLARFEAALGDAAHDPGVAYGWAKRGVIRLVQREAVTIGPLGARICSISPGMIDTPMGRREFEQQPMMKVLEDMTPLRRTGSADELAAVAAFCCSDEASFLTGTDLLVDGGACAAVTTATTP